MHSAAMRMRSAFIPSRMYRKPWPSSPTSASSGISTPSKKISVVAWFISVRMGRMVIVPASSACFMSTMKVDSPSVLFSTSSSGVVRASSSIRSECCAREVQIFWPFTR